MTFLFKKHLISIICICLSVVPSVSFGGTLDSQQGEQSYVVKIQGSPVGIAKEIWKMEADGRYYSFRIEIELSRMGDALSLSITQEGLESPDGKPKWFRSEIGAAETGSSIRGEVRGDTVYMKAEGLEFSEEIHIPWEEGAVGIGTADRIIRDRLMAGEDTFSLRVFDTDKKGFYSLMIKRKETVRDTIAGVAGEYLRVEQYEGDGNVPRSVSFLDADFFAAKITTYQMSMKVEFERVESAAADSIDLETGFDVISASRISLKGYPEPASRLRDITLRLTLESTPPPSKTFDGPNQKVLRQDGRSIDLLLTRDTVSKITLAEEKKTVYLSPDQYIQSNHPAVLTVARRIAAETDKKGWELACELASWVNLHVEHKDLGQGFASALEVLKSRRGDCTEHAVLLVSLLRAAGIPARVVSGLAYGSGALFGHMWTEAYVDYWRTLDALDLNADPIRIRISVSQDAGAFNMNSLANDFALLGGVKAEVLNFHFRHLEKTR